MCILHNCSGYLGIIVGLLAIRLFSRTTPLFICAEESQRTCSIVGQVELENDTCPTILHVRCDSSAQINKGVVLLNSRMASSPTIMPK